MAEAVQNDPNFLPRVEPNLLTATFTPEGKIVAQNKAWTSIFGDCSDPWRRLKEEDRRQITKEIAQAAGGALVTNQVYPVHRSDDDPLPVLMNFLPVHLPASADGKTSVKAVTATGETLAEPTSWNTGQTQRHRMETLGRMTMGIAHDFNNLLSALLGHAELLQRSTTATANVESPILKDSINAIEQIAVDGATLVEKIQRYIRQESQSKFEPIDLKSIVEDCITLTRPYWFNEPRRQGIAIELEQDLREVPLIEGSSSELREVLVNLVLNAVQAMPDGGTLRLQTVHDEGRGVQMIIEDTGMGMSDEVATHIFEPLFTTKGEEGSGMGLTVSYGIVQEHGGNIDVDSELGKGTTFTLTFPPVEQQAVVEKEIPETPTTQPAHVLIVDDEKRVRSVLKKLLVLKGHIVEQAASGAEALTLMEENDFDIVFTDYGMPTMNGRQLAHALRRRFPHLPIVILTGDTNVATIEEVDRVLSKPFKLDRLEATIQKLL